MQTILTVAHDCCSLYLCYNGFLISCTQDVLPDPRSNCGPYRPRPGKVHEMQRSSASISHNNHDTIGMVVIDSHGNVAAGTSTNGMNHKVPGYLV